MLHAFDLDRDDRRFQQKNPKKLVELKMFLSNSAGHASGIQGIPSYLQSRS